MNKKNRLEPGLLGTYRLLAWVLVAISLIQTISITLRLGWYDSPLNLLWVLPYGNVLMLGVLYWPWARKKTGRFFIPILVLIATVGGILRTYLSSMMRFHPDLSISILVEGAQNLTIPFETFEFSLIVSSGQLIPLLFIPLIMVAWQYDFKSVLIYVISSTLLDVLIFFSILGDQEIIISIISMVGILATRIFTFLVVGFLVTRMMAAQRRQRQQLRQANQQLLGYTMTLEHLATSRERNRLARELHDTLAHTLSGLAVQLGAVRALWDKQEAKARDKLDQAITATRQGLNETRRALKALRAEPLEDLGLTLAIQELAKSAAARTNAKLALNLPKEPLDISPELSQAFYRTAQEALENVSRHAQAKNIHVALALEENNLILSVRDDGVGFDAAQLDESTYGLRGLQERANLLDGQIEIKSEPGAGTQILFRAGVYPHD